MIRGGVNIQENANSLEKAVKSNLKKEATPIASFFLLSALNSFYKISPKKARTIFIQLSLKSYIFYIF